MDVANVTPASGSDVPSDLDCRAGLGIEAMSENGLITLQSAHDFGMTLEGLLTALRGKGITIFAQIDHAVGAASVGLALEPTTLVVFGNPAAGTPLMRAAQTAGIDLPLKVLIWQRNGAVYLTYNDPSWIAARHGLGSKVSQPVAAMAAAVQSVARQAAGLVS